MDRGDSQERVVLLIAGCLSLLATAYFFRTEQILLYGDAVAHINIARRVIDNMTPGPMQLGTVWLPLPHLLMLPFVAINSLWTNGLSGSLPSMLAYVVSAVGIFRLVRRLSAHARVAWIAVLFFALNPNFLYMQSTAMTESIYLAAMIWAVIFLCDFDRRLRDHLPGAGASLQHAAIALSACMLTRYDGWFFAALCAVAVAARLLTFQPPDARKLLRPAIQSAALCACTATLWFAWNYGIFGNAIEFATGPYSAKAIAERTTQTNTPPYPGEGHVLTAGIYFLKSAKLSAAEGRLEPWIFVAVLFGAIVTSFEKRRRLVLLLWAPLIFYPLSIAYGSIPIFIPNWWPFSYYNVRYGLQLLPAFAVSFALAAHYLCRIHLSSTYVRLVSATAILLSIAAHAVVIEHLPITLREARANSVSRIAMENQIARQLVRFAPDETVLMFTGEYSGALRRAQVPFRRVISEGNFGYWQSALADPAQAAEWIVAAEGDEVSRAVTAHPSGVNLVAVLHVSGKRPVTIYRTNSGHK